MKRCYIFGSADIADLSGLSEPSEEDIVIAADGGMEHLLKLGWRPDLFVGDMDSLSVQIPDGVPIERYPSEKDDTDTGLAVKKGLALGCDSFLFYGCLGGALSHTIANIQLLTDLAGIGKTAVLLGDETEIYAVHNGSLTFGAERRGRISVFSVSDHSCGVTLSGLKYPLEDASLTNRFALGVSNEFIGNESKITVKKGNLIVILEKKA